MMKSRGPVVLLLCSIGAVGIGCNDSTTPSTARDGGRADTGVAAADSGRRDATAADDAGTTTAIDAGTMPGVDAGPITGVDAGPMPGVDAGVMTGVDAGTAMGGAAYRGTVFFTEGFEDSNLNARGWYDHGAAVLEATEHAPVAGSASSFRCHFTRGATTCPGRPGRHALTDSESVYFSYWVQYTPGWVGSGHPYHPHEFHFLTNQDGRFTGPSSSHLTTYIENVGLVPRLALQDALNVDTGCVLRNDDSFVGCRGSFATYPFTEMRSVASCNGLVGDLDERDCYMTGAGAWYSTRGWAAPRPLYTTGVWHFVESYWRLNSVAGGVGRADGAIRLWVDGALVVSSDTVLMRTGARPGLAFNQFLVATYIGDGSPIAQDVLYDELTIAEGVP